MYIAFIIIKALFITFVIAGLVGWKVYSMTQNWWYAVSASVVTVLAQFTIGAKINEFRANYTRNKINSVNEPEQEIENDDPAIIQLSCAYCHEYNTVKVKLGLNNAFKCSNKDCGKPNKIYIQFTTTRVTRPISESIKGDQVDFNPGESTIRQTTANEGIKLK